MLISFPFLSPITINELVSQYQETWRSLRKAASSRKGKVRGFNIPKANTTDLIRGDHPHECSCPLTTQAVGSQCHLEMVKLSSTEVPQENEGTEGFQGF